jgi:CheY-like chemotaxis protein
MISDNGPIIVIEDDRDDQELLQMVFKNLNYGNEIFYFDNGEEALSFLNRKEVSPFLILSDVNMPRINGFELRNIIKTNEDLSIKCIPYLFFTTGTTKKLVVDAYSLSVQGIFQKPSGFDELQQMIKTIVDYWKQCIAPNRFAD